MRNWLIVFCLFAGAAGAVPGDGGIGTAGAASRPAPTWMTWKWVTEPIDGLAFEDAGDYYAAHNKWGGSAKFWIWWEAARRQYRERGLQLVERFPDDPGRFDWLAKTSCWPPFYWLDPGQGARAKAAGAEEEAIIDKDAARAWKVRSPALVADMIRNEGGAVTDLQVSNLLHYRMLNEVLDARYAVRRGDPIDAAALVRKVLLYLLTREDYSVRDIVYWLAQALEGHPEDRAALVEGVRHVRRDTLDGVPEALERVSRLQAQPVDWVLPGLEGETVDLGNWRGNLVLVEFWSLHCSSCIAQMPKLKQLRQTYENQGLKILGVCFEDDAERFAEVRRVLKEKAVDWTQVIQPWRDTDTFRVRYGFQGVPQYFLFDRNGLLVSTELEGIRRMEKVVRAQLGLAPLPPIG